MLLQSLFYISYKWRNWGSGPICNFPKVLQNWGADIKLWEPDPTACTERGPLSFVPIDMNWEDFLSSELPGQMETYPCLPLWPHLQLYFFYTLGSLIVGKCQIPQTHSWLIFYALESGHTSWACNLCSCRHRRASCLIKCCVTVVWKSLNNIIFEFHCWNFEFHCWISKGHWSMSRENEYKKYVQLYLLLYLPIVFHMPCEYWILVDP